MDVPQLSPQLIDALRTWFHPKDRSVYLAPSTFAYLPGGVGYFSMAFISEVVLTANAASITFSNIPQNFRHLWLACQVRSVTVSESDVLMVRFNGDSGANYDVQALVVNNATLTGVAVRGLTLVGLGPIEGANSRAANTSPVFTWISLYSNVTTEKWLMSFSCQFGNVSADADLSEDFRSCRWRNTNVITSFTLSTNSGANLVSGSRVQLYGIL